MPKGGRVVTVLLHLHLAKQHLCMKHATQQRFSIEPQAATGHSSLNMYDISFGSKSQYLQCQPRHIVYPCNMLLTGIIAFC